MLLLSIRVNNNHSRINICLGPGLFARIKDTIVKKCKCCGKNKPEDENAEKPAVQELKPKKKSGKVHRPFAYPCLYTGHFRPLYTPTKHSGGGSFILA